MCLIVVKPAGVNVPRNRQIVQWFNTHDDGAGIMYRLPDSNTVTINKGLMTAKAVIETKNDLTTLLKRYHRKLCDIDIIFHFRQATEGMVKPSNCHPFPITLDRQLSSSLKCETSYAIAHNGIIYDYGVYAQKNWQFNNHADITDTLMFIEDYLYKIGGETIVNNEGVRSLIESHTESKFAMLSKYGITTIGKFIEDKGLLYSNSSYVEYKPIPVKSFKADKTLLDYSGYRDIESFNSVEQCDICGQYISFDHITDIDNLYICDDCNKAMTNRALSRQPIYLTDTDKHSKYWQSLYSK